MNCNSCIALIGMCISLLGVAGCAVEQLGANEASAGADQTDISDILDSPDADESSDATEAEYALGASAIPHNLTLWVLDDRRVPRSEFGKFARWYSESGDVQHFRLHTGDVSTSRRIHARLEVYGGLDWKPGNQWHTFEATYKINTEVKDLFAIAQCFDYDRVHPQMMLIHPLK